MCSAVRQTHRLELLPRFEAPCPQDAVRGFHGLRVAHDTLTRLNIPGLLIGGVAFRAWLGTTRGCLSTRKDVDVVVLSHDPSHHPDHFEGGVDWWIPDAEENGPENGNGVQLVWRVEMLRALPPGLHIPMLVFLHEVRCFEQAVFGQEFTVTLPRGIHRPELHRRTPLITEYPVVHDTALRWQPAAR